MDTLSIPGPTKTWTAPMEVHKVGMVCLLVSEVAFFSTLVVTYVVFLYVPGPPPHPKDTLDLKLVIPNTICLLASSYTLHHAQGKRRQGKDGAFLIWLAVTMLLGVEFLAGTGAEWYGLIIHKQFTITTNLFGACFYTLVGFHSLHVTIGLVGLFAVWMLSAAAQIEGPSPLASTLIGWYWHFVDAVWIVVFSTVYLFGR
jgi:cytochrome c oxidase subunit 3/cytochrome o ubiquinol oxidase subunit 3